MERAWAFLALALLLAGCSAAPRGATHDDPKMTITSLDPFRDCRGEETCAQMASTTYEIARCLENSTCAPQGHAFVIVDAKIVNEGTAALNTSLGHFVLLAGDGEHPPDSATNATAAPMAQRMLDAGAQQTGSIAFNVPLGARAISFCYRSLATEPRDAYNCVRIDATVS